MEGSTPTPAPAAPTPTPAAPSSSAEKKYGVFVEVSGLDLSTAVSRKEVVEKLKDLECDGTVLVRVARAAGKTPKKAIENLGHTRDLDGDYEMIADSSVVSLPKVVAKATRSVSIGK